MPLRAMSVPANAIRTVWVPSVKKYRSYTYAIGYAEGIGGVPGARIPTGGGGPQAHDPPGGGVGVGTSAAMSQVPALGGAACAATTSHSHVPSPLLSRPRSVPPSPAAPTRGGRTER